MDTPCAELSRGVLKSPLLLKGGVVWVLAPAVGWQDGYGEQCGGLPVLTSLPCKDSQE